MGLLERRGKSRELMRESSARAGPSMDILSVLEGEGPLAALSIIEASLLGSGGE